MITRRQFAKLGGGALGTLAIRSGGVPLHQTDDWYAVQQAFAVDRSLIHLNNGGVCPSPVSVQRALVAHQRESNRHPYYAHEREIKPQLEAVRSRLATEFGCASEEIALTRNTSEGMEICQLGLELAPGDEVVTTNHDYPRMLHTWEQRVAREGIVVKQVPVQVPLESPQDLVQEIAKAIGPRTKLVMCCHMVDLTGQVLPVAEIVEAAHAAGVPVLVDGAQTFGHLPFRLEDLGCDFFATSLHKWISGPEGTGMLYVRRDLIPEVWPLTPAQEELRDDIRKFEDVGTRCHAPALAVGEALLFHAGIGAREKYDRLCDLRDYWLSQLSDHERIRLLTNLETAGSLATIEVDGLDPGALQDHLWTRYRIRVRPIDQVNVKGIRVSPGIYTTLPELDRFVSVLRTILRDGLPTT